MRRAATPDEGLSRALIRPLAPPSPAQRERGIFQRAVPIRQVDVDLAHFDAVLARIAHQLRRRVEAERLGVEHRRGEDVGIAALHPARGIDDQREARRVALGEAVFAEALDLAETALGEFALVAARDHALDHLDLKGLDRAGAAEGRHRAAQLVGFGGREAGGDDGDLHRLFLEQRHAERLAEHRLQLRRRIDRRLEPLAAAQIGMDHVALNWPGADDRHFDDEVVEILRPEPRQHRHLRAALDLEHADGVGALDHRVDASLFRRDRGERQPLSVMGLEQLEALAHRGQHAERQHVDLQNTKRVEVVLVPFDDRAVIHRRVHDRRDLVEPVAGDDEAAAVLREVARETDQFAGQIQRQRQRRRARIEPGGARPLLADRRRTLAPDGVVERDDRVVGQAEDLGGFADRRAGAIGRDRARQPRPLAAVALVDVLDDLLAPLVLEIDVDVGRFAALGRNEALEQQVEARRVDLGDPETVADRRVGRRAAPLAEDVLRASEADDVVHGEEIGRVAELADQHEFVVERGAHAVGDAAGIARLRAGLGEGFERRLRRG